MTIRSNWIPLFVATFILPQVALCESDAARTAVASQLFDDAHALLARGQTSEACAKYAESNRLDPQLGTLLYLGECYATLGRTASAWASFKDAVEMAQQRHDEREGAARERLSELQSKLSRLTIDVAQIPPANTEILQDGIVIGRAAIGTPLPIDPGRHEIRARAPGHKDWSSTIDVPSDASEIRVIVQPLEPQPAAAVISPAKLPLERDQRPELPSSQPDRAADTGASRRTLGYVVGGLGVVGIGVGTAFAFAMQSKVNERTESNKCSETASCTLGDKDRIDHLTNQARTDATVANVCFIAGSAAVIGGLALIITGLPNESKSSRSLRVKPWFVHTAGGIALGASW